MKGNYKRKQKILRHQRYIQRKQLNSKSRIIRKKHRGYHPLPKIIYKSPVFSHLDKAHFLITHNIHNHVANLDIPKVFCLSKNPDESLSFLKLIYSLLMDQNIEEIHFNHFSCKYMGICASIIMDIIILECIKYRKSIDSEISLSGNVKDGKVSDSDEVDSLVKMSGLLKHLNIYNGVLRNTEKLDLIKNEKSSYVAEKSIDYIDRSLKRHGYSLTKQGRNHFGKFFGEIVDNCSLHGGDKAIWYTIGHYSYDEKAGLGKCKLCIVDFGNTIYESLKYHSKPKILRRIDRYIKKTWYSFRSTRNEEVLFTLFSLQQRVSRIMDKESVRGNGTVTFIESFLDLFNTGNADYKSMFSITSGRCSILFDGKYRTQNKSFNEGYENKIIAFNANNNLYEEPDKNYVRLLKNSFPGTVVSMDLYIDSKYLQRSNTNG